MQRAAHTLKRACVTVSRPSWRVVVCDEASEAWLRPLSWSLVLKQKLQFLQRQAHPELLLGHQVQDLVHLIREIVHSVHVQHLGQGATARQPATS